MSDTDVLPSFRAGDNAAPFPVRRGFAARVASAWPAMVVLVVAALLRLHDVAADRFWKNELFSLTWVRHPFAWLVGEGMRIETNPPLYYIVLKGWVAVFGTGEAAARMPSVLAGVIAVGLTIKLGRELGNPRAGLLGGLLLAVTPVQIVYSHEARAYGLLPMFAVMAMIGANRLLRAANAATPASATPPVSAAVWFGLGAAGLLHTHATGAFAVAALGLVMLLALWDTPHPGPALRRLVVASLVAGMVAAPVLLALARQSNSDNIYWMPKFGLDTPVLLNRYLLIGPMVRTEFGELAAHYQLLAEMALGTLTAALLIGLALRRLRDGAERALLLFFPLLFVLLLAGVSLVRPILIPRVALWVSAPICLTAAVLLTGGLGRLPRILVGGLLGACFAVGLWNNALAPAQHKPDWTALLRDNPIDQAAGPTLVGGPHAGPLGVAFYAQGPIRRPLLQWLADPSLPVTVADRLERETAGATTIDTAGLASLIAAGGGVVLFLDDDDEILIDRHLAAAPWFVQARRSVYPGLIVFTW